MEQDGKVFGGIVTKAWTDRKFRARLMGNPIDTLRDAGLDVADGAEIRFVENRANTLYIPLPKGAFASDGESAEDVEKAAVDATALKCWRDGWSI